MPYRAQTEIEAANLALGEIGEPPIGSFNDNNARARNCFKWFGTVRDELMRSHDWDFCSAWVVPAMDPTPALGAYVNRFVLPDDCLKVRRVVPNPPAPNSNAPVQSNPNFIDDDQEQNGWTVENPSVSVGAAPPAAMVLVTNLNQPLVNYTRRVDIVRLWDAQFVTAFVMELGAKIAPAIAKDINAGEKLHTAAKERIEDAARIDSREQSARHVSRETSWVTSRWIGYWRPGMPRW